MLRKSAHLLTALALLVPGYAAAQSVVVSPEADISRLRLGLPELPTQPDLDLTIRNPEQSAVPKDVSSVDFFVSRVQVNGVSYFPEDRIRAIFEPLEGQRIRLEMLREKADLLQALYVERGFLLTRVIIPPQRIEDGTLVVEVVEGYIDDILLENSESAGARLAQDTLETLRGKRPLNIRQLDGKLLVLNEVPGIAVQTLLRPGSELGAASMLLSTSRLPNQGFASVSNTGSDSIGPALFSLGYTISSPLGRPGALDLSATIAGRSLEELQAVSARYAFPVNNSGAILYLGGLAARAKPGGVATDLDVSSVSSSLEARLRVPLHRTRSSALYLEGGLIFAQTRTTALSAEITDDKIFSYEAALRGRHQSPLGQTNAQISVTSGLPAFGALNAGATNPSVEEFKPHFRKLSGQLDHVVSLSNNISLLARVTGQWTDDRLLAGEQVAFGGPFLGRGYVPSSLTGDKGIGALAELRFGLPSIEAPSLVSNVQAYGFGDIAETKLLAADGIAAEKEGLMSYGLGLRALLVNRLFLDLQLSYEGREIVGSESRPVRVNLNLVSTF